MLPNDRAQPAAPDKPSWGSRLLRTYRRAPNGLKIAVAAIAILLFPATLGLIILAALVYGVVSVVQGRRTVGATASVALWGVVVFAAAGSQDLSWILSVTLMPVAVALAAHARVLARAFVPARTVAWVLAWSVPAGYLAFKLASGQPFIGTIAAWLLAAAVLGWRVAKAIQYNRMYGGRNPAGPGGPRNPDGPGGPSRSAVNPAAQPGGRPGAPGNGAQGNGAHGNGAQGNGAHGVRAQAAALAYGDHARDQSAPPRPRPQISVDDAMAELYAMIGLAPVKEQVR